ncbi:ferredoxin--NADP reductase [Halosimplex aquaticum]
MHERSPGDEIEIDPVDGDLSVRHFDRDAVFVATGTGITPLYPMLKQYVRVGVGDAHFVFGERDREHLLFRESLDQLNAEHENLSVDYVLSDADEEWTGRTGHVQDHLPEALAVGLDETDFYLCGVPEMVVETGELLESEGVDEARIVTEGWEADEVESN